MKNITLLSLAAVLVTASLSFGIVLPQYSGVFYSIIPCVFLLLTASREYGQNARYRATSVTAYVGSASRATSPLRLAA